MGLPYGRPCRDLVRICHFVTQHCRVGLLADIPTGLETESGARRDGAALRSSLSGLGACW